MLLKHVYRTNPEISLRERVNDACRRHSPEQQIPVQDGHGVDLEDVGAAPRHGLVERGRLHHFSIVAELGQDTEPLLRDQWTRRVAVVLQTQ